MGTIIQENSGAVPSPTKQDIKPGSVSGKVTIPWEEIYSLNWQKNREISNGPCHHRQLGSGVGQKAAQGNYGSAELNMWDAYRVEQYRSSTGQDQLWTWEAENV